MAGRARFNDNGAYTVPLNGSFVPPSTTGLPVNESARVNDKRLVHGASICRPTGNPTTIGTSWQACGSTKRSSTSTRRIMLLTPPASYAAETSNRNVVRPSETIGASYSAWKQGDDEAVLYADYRNAFKPSAQDFGPDYQPTVLLPETAQSYEAGIKGAIWPVRVLTYDVEGFLQNFQNLVVPLPTGFLTNAAHEQLEGVELETRYATGTRSRGRRQSGLPQRHFRPVFLLQRREQRQCRGQAADAVAAYSGIRRNPLHAAAGFQRDRRRQLCRKALSRRGKHRTRPRLHTLAATLGYRSTNIRFHSKART
jgi:hypothetical protein